MDKIIAKLIKAFKAVRNRIAFKLIFWIGLALVVSLEVIFYVDIKSNRELMENQMKLEACRLSEIIKRSTHHDMMRARSGELQEVLETIGAQEDVKKARIIERGKIKITSHKEELGSTVDKKAESCYDCHKEEGEKPLTVSRYRFFTTEDGEHVMGFVNPLYNDKECQSCHGAETRVLGILDIIVSMENVHQTVKTHQRLSFLSILACFIIIALLIGIFIMKSINRPIKELTRGIQRIADGDLEYRIPIHTKDEIGELAESFNTMTSQLDASRKRIEAWNEELSNKVKDATAELEKTNQELAVANQKLSQSDKKKSEVVMLVAHDIRAPLAAIKSCLRVVLDGYLKNDHPKELEMIQRAEERVESQLDFVKNLLDFTRMEEEHREMRLEHLAPIVRNVVDMMHTWASDKQISVELRNLPEVTLMGDEDLLSRSLTNLISNAIKYSPPGTLVWVDCNLKGDETIEIQVGDNGVGIPEDELPNIFEILFRGVHAKRQHDNGAGLGLSIVKRAVELHGGEVKVKSKVNVGTIFYITLPILKKEEIKTEEAVAVGAGVAS